MVTQTELDGALIDDVTATLRDERRRAPADLLAILTVLLLGAAMLLLVVGIVVGDGVARDLTLNLTGEFVGAALTVVLIGGLWRQLQTSSYGAIDELVRLVGERRTTGLTEEERVAFAAIVDLHRRTAGSGLLARQASGLIYMLRHRQQLRVLEDLLRPWSASGSETGDERRRA